MKIIAIAVASLWLAGSAMAQPATSPAATAGAACKTKAGNLHGAALTSTVKSCCKTQAADQKLHGAAATSFQNACEKAALGG